MAGARRPRCGVLLAGGRGTRFGSVAKGLAPFSSGRVCDAALRALHDTCDTVMVAANDADAPAWFPGLRIVADDTAGLGALGALHTALQAAGDAVAVVCAWDLPLMEHRVLQALADAVDAGAPACVPVHGDGQLEPLVAAYAPACAAVAAQLLASGERAAHALCAAVGGTPWPVASHLPPGDAARIFHNVNTPDDLTRARAWLPTFPA